MTQVLITDLEEIVAVWEGEIDGDYYDSDGETWADVDQLERWRERRFVAAKLAETSSG